jgi:polyhydroxybutyrate depolymerase
MKNTLIILLVTFFCLGCKKEQKQEQEKEKEEEKIKNDNQNLQSFNHNGVDREYFAFIPSNYNSASAVPLVLNFHGFGGNSSGYSTYASMEALAEKENFILIYPDGTEMDSYSHWNPSLPSSSNKSSANDLGFIDMLIQQLSKDYSIDPKRVYACGFSNGGMMSFGLAHHKSNLIAAVASVSGTMLDAEVSPTHPMPVLIIHGTNDYIISYNGNNEYNSVESTLNYWMSFNKIESLSKSDTSISGNNTIQYFSYENGENGVSVEHYKIVQGGHEWFNLNYDGQNTGELIWNFFSKYDIDGFIE